MLSFLIRLICLPIFLFAFVLCLIYVLLPDSGKEPFRELVSHYIHVAHEGIQKKLNPEAKTK